VFEFCANEQPKGGVQMRTKDWPEYGNGPQINLSERPKSMITSTIKFIAYAWNFIFNHEVSPLRNIPDVAIRHYVLQVLGLLWAVSFSLAIGSYTFLAASLLGHTVLIAAAAITVATLTAAAKKPQAFIRASGRRRDGKHE
jgi:hypothetical protein